MQQEKFTVIKSNPTFQSEIYVTDRFIHRCIVFVIWQKINQESWMANLISRILSRGTKKFLRSYELSRYLYSLYGTYLDGSLTKWGSNLVYTLTIKSLIPENWKDTLSPSLDLALEMMLNAHWDHGLLFEPYFEEERKNMLIELKDLKNDRFWYAFEEFIQWMFSEEPFGLSILGTPGNINSIQNAGATKYYSNNFLHQNRMLFFVDGGMTDEYKNTVNDYSTFSSNETPCHDLGQNFNPKTPVKRKTENDKIQQSWIFMGYRMRYDFDNELYPALLILNHLLGGHSNSILFRKIREEKGICYFVNSSLPAGINSLIVTGGILWKNHRLFEGMVEEEINYLSNHEVSTEVLAISKDLTLSSIESISDHPFQLISIRIESILFHRIQNIEDFIQKIKKVSQQEIRMAANLLRLDSVYILKGIE